MLAGAALAAETTQSAMGTVMWHKAFGAAAADALAAACDEVAWLEERLSCFLPGSEISRVNRSAGIKSEAVSGATGDLLAEAFEFSRRFPAFFDVTIRPLVCLWRAARQTGEQPDAQSIARARALVDYRDLTLDPWQGTAGLRRAGQSIDLGGIAKGFAADRVAAVLREAGVVSAYSNLGGNVVTLGTKPDGAPWRIGIQHPRQADCLLGAVAVVGRSVVTSGDYQRYFIDRGGVRCHHLLDPLSGYPCRSGLISVSIVAESSLLADALSTIVFAAGLERGLEALRGYPQVDAILVDETVQVFVTRGLKNCFQADEGVRWCIVD